MFEKLKAKFSRKKEEKKVFVPPRSGMAYSGTAIAPSRDDSEDFATSMMIGMATNNAMIGGMLGGSFTGGMVGDIARDGAIGDVSTSHHSTSDCGSISSISTIAGIVRVTTSDQAVHLAIVDHLGDC